jgi:hypothetical protein
VSSYTSYKQHPDEVGFGIGIIILPFMLSPLKITARDLLDLLLLNVSSLHANRLMAVLRLWDSVQPRSSRARSEDAAEYATATAQHLFDRVSPALRFDEC